MYKRILSALILTASLTVFSIAAHATTFTYSGRVATSYDENGNGISGAFIFIQGIGSNPPYTNYTAESDSEGFWSRPNMVYVNEPGFYYQVYCYRSPFSFDSQYGFQEDSGFYFIPE